MEAQVYKKDDMVKIAAIAARWGVSRQHVYNLIDRGQLKPAFRFGGKRGMWVPRSVVESFEGLTAVDPNR